eukprot:c27183_g3_i1 orf=799-2076(-)
MLLKSSSFHMLVSLNPCVAHQDALNEFDFQCNSPRAYGFVPRIVPCHHSSMARSATFPRAHYCSVEVKDSTRATWQTERGLVAICDLRRAQSEGDLACLSDGVARRNGVSSFVNSWVEGAEYFALNSSSLQRQWSRRMKHNGRLARSRSTIFEVGSRDSIVEHSDISATGQGDHKANDTTQTREQQEQLAGFLRGDVLFRNCERESTKSSFHKAQCDGNEHISVATESRTRRRTETFEMEDGEVYSSFSKDSNGTPLVCNCRGCRPLSQSERGQFRGSDNSDGTIGSVGGDPDRTETYYRNWLQDDPQNALLLRNFAKFMYEIKHDYREAEKLYERAVLSSPSDGELLSEYAKLVWDLHRDEDRAGIYYNRAVQAAPDDCYVMGSYASFVWDSEDNEQSINNPSSSLHPKSTSSIQAAPRLVASA